MIKVMLVRLLSPLTISFLLSIAIVWGIFETTLGCRQTYDIGNYPELCRLSIPLASVIWFLSFGIISVVLRRSQDN